MIKNFLQYLTCEKYMELSSKEIVGELTLVEKFSHFVHHLICTFCRRARRQIRVIDSVMKNSADECCGDYSKVKLSAEQKERVKKSLKK